MLPIAPPDMMAPKSKPKRKMDSGEAMGAVLNHAAALVALFQDHRILKTSESKAKMRALSRCISAWAGEEPLDEGRQQVAAFLGKSGRCKIGKIEKELGIPELRLSQILNHSWFVETDTGFCLTVSGRRANED